MRSNGNHFLIALSFSLKSNKEDPGELQVYSTFGLGILSQYLIKTFQILAMHALLTNVQKLGYKIWSRNLVTVFIKRVA